MQGAISTLNDIRQWFFNLEAPFWTLSYYSTASPTGMGAVIGRNIKFGELDKSWEMLEQSIRAQTGAGRAQLNLIVYEKPSGSNTPAGRTNIDIVSNGVVVGQQPGIGSLGGGQYLDESRINAIIEERQQIWELKRENQDLREQIENPNGFADKAIALIERIGSTPMGMAIASKLLGTPMPPMEAAPAVNGTPPPANGLDDEDVETELDSLEAIAAQNGITLKQLLAKTAALASQQPGVVQMLIQQ